MRLFSSASRIPLYTYDDLGTTFFQASSYSVSRSVFLLPVVCLLLCFSI